MKIQYRKIKLNRANKIRLDVINSIIREYQADGYVLTLRQLYYQLVSRDVIANSLKEYKKLCHLLKEGRMAGIVDWEAIEDRLRKPESPNQFDDTDDAMNTIIAAYALPRQRGQSNYIEVWVEKDALSGVLYRVTGKYHVPILVNRGYSSATAMHDAYKRMRSETQFNNRSQCIILYLGDFDPSGQDMIRDIEERIKEFSYGDNYDLDFEIKPIALTKRQIKQYDPPPNPAKLSDSRAAKYVMEHGYQSWEVDALPPKVLNKLLETEITDLMDLELYKSILRQEKIDKNKLRIGQRYIADINDEEE